MTLHGGGIRFIAERTTREIADAFRDGDGGARLRFRAAQAAPGPGPPAEILARRQAPDGAPGGDAWRLDLPAATRRMLDLPPEAPDGAGDDPAGAPIMAQQFHLYLPIVPLGEGQAPIPSGLLEQLAEKCSEPSFRACPGHLPAICDAAVIADLRANGRRLIFPGLAVPALFRLPLEFAAACFRFGHSMVNSHYPWSAGFDPAGLGALSNLTHLGMGLVTSPVRRLPDGWRIDWARFHAGRAARVDCAIAQELGDLPAAHFDAASGLGPALDPASGQPGLSLAWVTLFRANQLGLASGQGLRAAMLAQGVAVPPLPGPVFPEGHALCAGLGPAQRDFLNQATPLWLYTLREAELAGTGRLGPLASRVSGAAGPHC